MQSAIWSRQKFLKEKFNEKQEKLVAGNEDEATSSLYGFVIPLPGHHFFALNTAPEADSEFASDGFLGLHYSSTFIHELGHVIDFRRRLVAVSSASSWVNMSWEKRLFTYAKSDVSNFYQTYGIENPSEDFADSVDGYFVNPFFPCFAPDKTERLLKRVKAAPGYDVSCESSLATIATAVHKIEIQEYLADLERDDFQNPFDSHTSQHPEKAMLEITTKFLLGRMWYSEK